MKKNGFTLAEVLITLAIIGVVATMTLPALIANTGEQQARSAFKKSINTLTEAANLHKAIAGYNFDELVNSETPINTTTDDQAANTLVALLRARTAIDFKTTGAGGTSDTAPKTLLTVTEGIDGGKAVAPNTAVIFRDGTALLYNNGTAFNAELESDNLTKGLLVVVDTNGVKGPNALSNCKGNKKGANDDLNEGGAEDSVSVTACEDKTKRVINDRFLVRLRGSVAQPEGAAATWTFQN